MKAVLCPAIILSFACLGLSGCHNSEAEEHHEEVHRKVVVTTPKIEDVTTTQRYVCNIHSRRHIEICALEGGYLEAIPVKEGQFVKQGDLMFKIYPPIYKAELDSAEAEAKQEQIAFEQTKRLYDQKVGGQRVVSEPELRVAEARFNKARAQYDLALAKINFTNIKAPFDGIIDKQYHQQGSLIAEGDVLSTLSDNQVMWVYFYVPEKDYLKYKADLANHPQDVKIQLVLANGDTFPHLGLNIVVEADFNSEFGTVAFRADFPNPEGILRHGQTGTVLLSTVIKNATVIPQRCKFEILDKNYVYIVGEDNVVHQREIQVLNELDDLYVINAENIKPDEKIIFEGVRLVRDGESVEFEFKPPDEVLNHLKYHAE